MIPNNWNMDANTARRYVATGPVFFLGSILFLAGMELTSFTATLVVPHFCTCTSVMAVPTASKLYSLPRTASRLGVGRRLGGDVDRTPNEQRDIPNIWHRGQHVKAQGKGGGRGPLAITAFTFSSNYYLCWGPVSQEESGWEVMNEFLFLLWLHTRLLLSMLSYHYLNLQVSSHSFFFLPIIQKRGTSKRQAECWAAGQG